MSSLGPEAALPAAPVTDDKSAMGDYATGGFHVHLDVFEGPFDLLLSLIAKRQLDVTLVALAQVTDEFIAHIKLGEGDWDLDQASGFLVVAATLLDLKVARLLPAADDGDEEDLALLEARDLLFARLLQYRAFKQIAGLLATRFAAEGRKHPRAVPLEPAFATLLPEVLLGVGPRQFAELAARAMTPKPRPVVAIDHLHAPKVSVREQAVVIARRLRQVGAATFRGLTADAGATIVVVARFLALLELYREGAVAFDQVAALGELHVRWVGSAETDAELERWAHETGEHDEYDGVVPSAQEGRSPEQEPERS